MKHRKKLIALLLSVMITVMMIVPAVSVSAEDTESAALLRGDADLDGSVTILDATRIQRYLAKMITEEEISMEDADADRDGKVTVLDATRIQRVLAKLCDMDGVAPPVPGEDQLIIITDDSYELPIMR